MTDITHNELRRLAERGEIAAMEATIMSDQTKGDAVSKGFAQAADIQAAIMSEQGRADESACPNVVSVSRSKLDALYEQLNEAERERDELKARVAELEGELQQAKTINQGHERWNEDVKRILSDARQQRIDETAMMLIASAYPGNTVTPHDAYEAALALEAERERRVGDDV